LQVQVEKRNTQASQIRDLLHLLGEKPLLPEGEQLMDTVRVCPPQLATATQLLRTMDVVMRIGLPPELPQVAIDAIFRGITRLTRGTQPILDWSPPLIVGSQLKLTLEDKQLLLADPRRRVVVTLRAMATFQGKAAYDCVKVLLEEDDGASSIYFGKCLAFIRDQRLQHYVVPELPLETRYWALLSPREHEQYKLLFQ